jgi:two-component system, OmpR family, response regulator CpxR
MTDTATYGRILVIDDDLELCALMKEFFAQHGLELDAEHDGLRGLARALEGRHQLVILDVMLPGLDGFDILRQLRRRSRVPVIMLTARTALEDRIVGLDEGADDYLPKPFGPGELLARLRAVLRRTGEADATRPAAFEVNGIRLDPATRQVWAGGQPIEVTAIEFTILERLARSAGRVVSRDELIALLHQREASPFDRSVDVHVHHLRRKLGDRPVIKTIRGEGYLFCPE